MSKYNIDIDEIYELYIVKNMRRKEVAETIGCSDSYVKDILKKYNIKKPFELECKNKERKVEVLCQYCNEIYKTQKFRTISEKYDSRYCSYSCAQKARYLGEEHKQKVRNCIGARRRARLRNQTPKLTQEEQDRIKQIYINCPDGYEVDHIIPISKGGLHHPDNLQLLTISENRRKHNKIV